MSEDNPIRVFVTHNFTESDDYLRVFEFLESMDRFYYLNVSKPDNKPAGEGFDAVKDELIAQIKASEVVIVLASEYAKEGALISYQLDIAEANEKPLICIRPYGGMLETPAELLERLQEHIEWNERAMVDAIQRQARLEDTTRWDVVDFP